MLNKTTLSRDVRAPNQDHKSKLLDRSCTRAHVRETWLGVEQMTHYCFKAKTNRALALQ